MANLPDKPSELIRVALADLRKVEAMPKVYRINMEDWWFAGTNDEAGCSVCLAGAVMAETLGAPRDDGASPSDFPNGLRGKLLALDSFRQGEVLSGLIDMDQDWDAEVGESLNRAISAYSLDPECFHRDMNKLADDLEAVGL